jgi:hypothetical protein
VHRPTADYKKHVLYTLLGDKADYIIGKLHWSNLKWERERSLNAEAFNPW